MTYVMSDIHGNLRRFQSIMDQINLQETDTLYVLGDVIDRFPDGLRILRKLMAMPNVHMILGNHEYMMRNAVENEMKPGKNYNDYCDRNKFSLWYRNGGWETHNYWKHIRKTIRAEIYQYLKSLPVNLDITVGGKHYKLSHSSPLELYPDFESRYETPEKFAVWRRMEPYDPLPDDYTLIFGHTGTDHYQLGSTLRIWHGNGRIGIDCGSGYPEKPFPDDLVYGRLACLRLDDMKEFYSEELWHEEDEE